MDKKQEQSEANALRLELKRSDNALLEFLSEYGLRRDMDVDEIYLASAGLTSSIRPLERFRNLRILWLQSNKIKRLPFIQNCKSITEIYLQSNFIQTIDHCFRKLTTLEVIHLQANQLSDLKAAAKELSYLKKLRDLNLFDNPLELEKDYRQLIFYTIPSLKILDRKTIGLKEKINSKSIYEPERVQIDQKHAFLRCNSAQSNANSNVVLPHLGNNNYATNNHHNLSRTTTRNTSTSNNNLNLLQNQNNQNSTKNHRSLSLWSSSNIINTNSNHNNRRQPQSQLNHHSKSNTKLNNKSYDMENLLRGSQSIKEFTFFDWSKVKLKSDEIQQSQQAQDENNLKYDNFNFTTQKSKTKLKELPQVVTIRFT